MNLKNNFDWTFYTSYYSDLKDLNTYEMAYNHWIKFGKKENRLINEKLLDEQNKKILIVTSFNDRGLKEYAGDFLNTYNLPFDLVVYSEDKVDLSEFKIKNLKFENLYDDKEFENFIKSDPPTEFTSRRNYDKCDENCPEYCFEHQFNINGKVTNGFCKKAKKLMQDLEIEHKFIESTTKEGKDFMEKFNATGVPLIINNKDNSHIIGYNEDKIRSLKNN